MQYGSDIQGHLSTRADVCDFTCYQDFGHAMSCTFPFDLDFLFIILTLAGALRQPSRARILSPPVILRF